MTVSLWIISGKWKIDSGTVSHAAECSKYGHSSHELSYVAGGGMEVGAMGRGIDSLESAYQILFTGVLIILALLLLLCLIRAVAGPRIADRIVAANMMGTIVIVTIAILALMLGEGYLADICIIYAMISFLAVIVLTKVYMGAYRQEKEREEREERHDGSV